MDLPIHQLSLFQLDQFFAGAVDTDVMAVLRDGQYSRRRLLLSALVDLSAGKPEASGPLESTQLAWHILATVDERAPDVVEDVVMSPSVGVWLVRTVSRLHDVALDGPPLWVELGFLHSLAAAVAVRAGLPCVVGVPVVDGVVSLPTVGQIRFRDDTRSGFANVCVSSTGVALRTLPGGGHFELLSVLDAPEFFPVCGHAAVRHGWCLDVDLDDATPYRRFSAPEPPRPLPHEELVAWRDDLDEAWEVLVRWHPRFAAELSTGLTSLAPISPPSRVVGASASAAFGGVAVSRADSPTFLAATLVHELQHSKLNALLDLVVLHTGSATELVYVPWRDDPRPLTGLLHGVYAFTSTVEFWHVQRRRVPESVGPRAVFTFAHRHMQVWAAVESVTACPDLTVFGTRLVEAAASRLARCSLDDVPDEMVDAVGTIMVEHRARWRVRHVRPAAAYVQEALRAWCGGISQPLERDHSSTVEPDRREYLPPERIRLLTMKTLAPARFAEFVENPDSRASTADVAFVSGDYDVALAAYSRRLLSTPTDGDAWIGLGLTLRATGDNGVARVLLERPEVVVDVSEHFSPGVGLPPIEFARSLSAVVSQPS